MKVNKEENITTVSEENIYKLNGRVPLNKAIPFGLQHVLAMFVSNLAPVLIVCSAALVRGTGDHLTAVEITRLLQCAMFVAGIGTCLQLYPIWKIGSKLPIVKAKVGPKISVLIADEKVFDQIPVKKEVKAEVSGLYIVGVKGIRGSLETPAPKKKGFFKRLLNK